MQQINAAYHDALNGMHGYTSVGTDGKEHTYKYNEATEQAIMDKVVELLKLGQANLKIEVVGLWVWVSGSRKDQKDLLNKNGAKMKWHSKRQRWYWKPYKSYTRYNPDASFGDLQRIYGSKKFQHIIQMPALVTCSASMVQRNFSMKIVR
jgi:hypothetical protein